MKRTTKRYVISTSALNLYKYRVLSEGGDFEQYYKNPLLLWMHQRAFGNTTNQILPLGRAVDIKLNGDEWSCYLEFDETDPFAMQVYNKYENGTLNMLSLGAEPIEWSDDPEQMLPGQVGPTFTKWKATDISCVDRGGNDDACACELFGADEKKIELSGLDKDGFIKLFSPQQQTKNEEIDTMSLIQLTGPALTGILLALKLDNTATEGQVQKAVADVIQLNATQAAEIQTLTKDKTDLATENKTLKEEKNEATVIALVDKNANKFLPGQRDNFIKLAKVDLESTKALLEGLPALQTVKEKLELAAGENTELDGLIKLSWDTLFHDGKLERLKELDNDAFLAKRAEKFPVKPVKK